jgi:hypothetical protein
VSEALGEVELNDSVLVIRRIHVVLTLKAETPAAMKRKNRRLLTLVRLASDRRSVHWLDLFQVHNSIFAVDHYISVTSSSLEFCILC